MKKFYCTGGIALRGCEGERIYCSQNEKKLKLNPSPSISALKLLGVAPRPGFSRASEVLGLWAQHRNDSVTIRQCYSVCLLMMYVVFFVSHCRVPSVCGVALCHLYSWWHHSHIHVSVECIECMCLTCDTWGSDLPGGCHAWCCGDIQISLASCGMKFECCFSTVCVCDVWSLLSALFDMNTHVCV